MKEQRATDELYKIAVEKGFVPNKTASMYVVRQNGSHSSTDGPEWKKEKPTLSLLQKWLREVHNLDTLIYKEDIDNYTYHVWGETGRTVYNWDTYEEALEKGLQEALKII